MEILRLNDGQKLVMVIACAIFVCLVILIVSAVVKFVQKKRELEYQQVKREVFGKIGTGVTLMKDVNRIVEVKSRQAIEKYDDIKYFMENPDQLENARSIAKKKQTYAEKIDSFLSKNDYRAYKQYNRLVSELNALKLYAKKGYIIEVRQISSAGNQLAHKVIPVGCDRLDHLIQHPELLMTKGEYNKFQREQSKKDLNKKQLDYYDRVNQIIDHANEKNDVLVRASEKEVVDRLITNLFDRTVNSIGKIKSLDSAEWDMINNLILDISEKLNAIFDNNQRILDYYASEDFSKIKDTCASLMDSQREFNEYINEKAQSIATLFGTRIVRNATVNEDKHNYIRPYNKSITPFTAEVSSAVFASSENSPLDYIVKYFYPNKTSYPEQIQKLQQLLEELDTLKEAKQIIENYKKEYDQYIVSVPSFILEQDSDGFYSRLGFATIDEHTLTVEYKFVYTSDGGFAQRSFSVPMDEDTIAELIHMLENRLSAKTFVREQRTLMTGKLRLHIKERDNYTCCQCGNSTYVEPNLLLEIDHIIPVAKGGLTEENNLQTLCWKCNRAKGAKLIE